MANGELQRIQELEREVRLLREILDQIHESVFITDLNNNVLWINKAEEDLEGKSKEEVIGKAEAEIWPQIETRIHDYTIRTGKPVIEQTHSFFHSAGYKMGMISSTYPFWDNERISAVYSIGFYPKKIDSYFTKALEYNRKLEIAEKETNVYKNGTRFTLSDIIGKSKEINVLIETTRKIAFKSSSVIICGETGTGKEMFAQGMHNASLTADGPFVAVNCAAIPETLLESMLFGTVKGAFTGATDKPGLFEQAQKGTLFLDEINSMTLFLQSKLLRVLQERTVRRIGDTVERPIDCRIISAANEDPLHGIKEKSLRQDLYYRLSAASLYIPPLRERKEDILVLAEFFIKKYNGFCGTIVEKLDRKVENLFLQYDWFGNIRELEHVIEYALNIVSKNEKRLTMEYLPQHFLKGYHQVVPVYREEFDEGRTLNSIIDEFEKGVIEEALRRNEGNITKTAKKLGIIREGLHYRIKKHGLKKIVEW